MKNVRIQSFSGPSFPPFGLNMDHKNSMSLRIQFECGKIRTRKTPNMATFHAVCIGFNPLPDGNKTIKYNCLITNCNHQYHLSMDYLIANKVRLSEYLI